MLRIQSLLRGFTVLIFLWSTSALAAYVCPNGPGPGEVMVGTQGGSGGIAVIPMCDSDGSANDGSADADVNQGPRWIDSYLVVVEHFDANDVWVTWDHPTGEEAIKAALEACNKVMGSGCRIMENGRAAYNYSVAVVDDDGLINNLGWGKTPDDASKDGLKKCTQNAKNCKVRRTFTAKAWKHTLFTVLKGAKHYFPDQTVPRMTYVLVAWAKTEAGNKWWDKTWVSSGKGYEESKQRVLSLCKQDSGLECELIKTVANGVILSIVEKPSNAEIFVSGRTLEDAKIAMKNHCTNKKVECVAGKSYDYKTPRLEMTSKEK